MVVLLVVAGAVLLAGALALALFAWLGLRSQRRRQELLLADLQAVRDRASSAEKMALLGQLLAGVAHEMNTPLAAVKSMYDLLRRSLAILPPPPESGEWSEDQLQVLANQLPRLSRATAAADPVIDHGLARLCNLIDQLRIAARGDVAELEACDVHERLAGALLLLEHELKHNVEVVRDYGALPPIQAVPGQIEQVFLNLLVNARQAIAGTGTITVTTAAGDGTVRIAISDTGPGIAAADREHIFDLGFTTKAAETGTGMGLAICRRLVAAHGGEILVSCGAAGGSTFTVVLPTDLTVLHSLPRDEFASDRDRDRNRDRNRDRESDR